MTEPPVRRRPLTKGRVLRTERVTPHMIRVTLGGSGLAGFGAGAFTDHYVKLQFLKPGVRYPEPLDLETIRSELPRDHWPVSRTYTVRSWDPEALELTLDFVHHGDKGIAGPWAAQVKPGEEIHFSGPGGAYAPSEEADWHLLAGDESALPAIAAALERIPDGRPAHVFIEVAGPADEQPLAKAEITWLHRGAAPVGELVVRAVRDLDFPEGRVHAFVHGEATMVKELRRELRVTRGIPLDQLSISGYWRLGRDEDGWQGSKREWNRQVEEEESAALR